MTVKTLLILILVMIKFETIKSITQVPDTFISTRPWGQRGLCSKLSAGLPALISVMGSTFGPIQRLSVHTVRVSEGEVYLIVLSVSELCVRICVTVYV